MKLALVIIVICCLIFIGKVAINDARDVDGTDL